MSGATHKSGGEVREFGGADSGEIKRRTQQQVRHTTEKKVQHTNASTHEKVIGTPPPPVERCSAPSPRACRWA